MMIIKVQYINVKCRVVGEGGLLGREDQSNLSKQQVKNDWKDTFTSSLE
jgi:hypothetical protein